MKLLSIIPVVANLAVVFKARAQSAFIQLKNGHLLRGKPNSIRAWLLQACFPLLLISHSLAQAVPHHISSISVTPDETVTLQLDGTVSNFFVLPPSVYRQFTQMFDLFPIDVSSNLVDWNRRTELLRTNSDSNSITYRVKEDPHAPHTFYRTLTNTQLTALPQPSGPFAVGTISRVLTDPARSNRYGIKTNSGIMATFWYPADSQAGRLAGAYCDAAVAVDRNLYLYYGWSLPWTNLIRQCVAHSTPDLPIAAGTNRFPLVLHSHGYTVDRKLNSVLAAELASHGYVVAAVDHEDCHATVYPDARGARYVPPGSIDDLTPIAQSRVKDIQFLLRNLSAIDQSDSVLAGRLDLERIGVSGTSFGGATMVEILRTEPTIKCGAFLEPITRTNYDALWDSQPLGKPFLTMNGTLSIHTDIIPTSSEFAAVSQVLYTLAASNAIWLKITNANHMAFTDLAWDREGTSYSRAGSSALTACALWMFDTYLKDEQRPFPTNAPITALQRK